MYYDYHQEGNGQPTAGQGVFALACLAILGTMEIHRGLVARRQRLNVQAMEKYDTYQGKREVVKKPQPVLTIDGKTGEVL